MSLVEKIFNCVVKNMRALHYVKGAWKSDDEIILELNDGSEVTINVWHSKKSVHVKTVHADSFGFESVSEFTVKDCNELVNKLNKFLISL